MMRGLAFLLFVLVGGSPARPEESWGPWKLDSDQGGLRVEYRKSERTGVVQTRATALLGCDTVRLWKLLTTSESYVKLMPKTLESRHLVERLDRNEAVVYQRMDGSPTSDRDYTLLVRWTVDETPRGPKYHRSWSVANDAGPPPVDGVVRVRVNDGHWTFTPAAGGKTQLEYVNYIELGGSLWKSLANGEARDSARGFLQNLATACRS